MAESEFKFNGPDWDWVSKILGGQTPVQCRLALVIDTVLAQTEENGDFHVCTNINHPKWADERLQVNLLKSTIEVLKVRIEELEKVSN